jgi:HlyD family secretion protein
MVKRSVRWLVVAAAVVGVVLVLRATAFRPRPIDVEVARVARGPVEDAVTNSEAGAVRSRDRARVGAEHGGAVVAIPHRENSRFHRGDVLIQLDTVTARVQLDLARRDLDAEAGALAAARAAATLARQEFDRIARLHEERVVSQEQMDQSRSRLDAAIAELEATNARVARARTAVLLAQDEFGHLHVRAPFDGVVTQRFVEVGETVAPGQPALEIMSPDHLYVSAPIDEIDIDRLREGLPARVTLDPYRGVSWTGEVTRVAPFVNDVQAQNRTLEVEVALAPDPQKPEPRPGVSADVEIILDRRENVLRVPTFAVIEGARVLVAANGRAVARDVTIGIKNWQWTEIRSGLNEGEAVITSLDRPGVRAGAVVTSRERAPGSAAPERAEAAAPAAATRP